MNVLKCKYHVDFIGIFGHISIIFIRLQFKLYIFIVYKKMLAESVKNPKYLWFFFGFRLIKCCSFKIFTGVWSQMFLIGTMVERVINLFIISRHRYGK